MFKTICPECGERQSNRSKRVPCEWLTFNGIPYVMATVAGGESPRAFTIREGRCPKCTPDAP